MNTTMKNRLILGLAISVCCTNSWAASAVPDIKANQSDVPIKINATDNLSVTVALNSNDQNENADWWLVVDAPTGLFSYQEPVGWQAGIAPMKQAALATLPQQEVLNIMGLPAGAYTFYFGFDSNVNAQVDLDQGIYDTVKIVYTSTNMTYPIVDTGQGTCYNNGKLIDCPAADADFYGQDAQYTGTMPSYTNNGNGTITDNVTGLLWAQNLSSYTMEWSEAAGYCESLETGAITDWRLPSVKELWSLRDFSTGWPWLDTDYFYLVSDGSDLGQHHSWTSNLYLVESEYQNEQVQGDPAWIVNDWTGHIKAMSGRRFVRCVSGDEYGINDFVDNGDKTVTDNATGLMWMQDDSGSEMDWEAALKYAQDSTYAGYDDWRLPNIKELQSIADYSKDVIPAIDTSVFNLSKLTNIKGQTDYPFYWSSTSNPIAGEDNNTNENVEGGNKYAWLMAFGYNTDTEGNDLHGAGSIVFDTKSEDVSDGSDIEVIYHHVRLVRGGDVSETPNGNSSAYRGDDETRVDSFPEGDMASGGGNAGGRPDTAAAAAQLGVTEEALLAALGDPAQGAPDFAAAAAALGVTEEELTAALGGTQEQGALAEPPAPNAS